MFATPVEKIVLCKCPISPHGQGPLRSSHLRSYQLSNTGRPWNIWSQTVSMSHERMKCRILIVDDEREITEILADLLSTDYECMAAGSAEEALTRLRDNPFELVISDITMPGMSGLEMIPHVKQMSPHTVVVMISGMQTVESAIGALRLGAFDYLMKPFDLRQVEAVVKRAIQHQELIIAKQRYEDHLEELVVQRTTELDR